MSALERVTGKSYKTVIRQSPTKAAEKRRRLEASFSLHQKHDPILQAAYPILYNFSYSTFAGYMNPLEIEPLFFDDAVFLHHATFYGAPASAMYVIGRYRMFAKVCLFLNVRSGQVFVQDQEELIELPEWLKTLPPPIGSVRGKRGYECLLAWWAAKGRMFEIMELPAELWTCVFELAFGMDIYPDYSEKLGLGQAHRRQHPNALHEVKVVDAPTISILSVDKQVHAELLPFAHKHTCKCFADSDVFHTYIRDLPAAPLKFDHLRILELDFSLLDFMFFFGVEITPFDSVEERQYLDPSGMWREATILKHLPALAYLYLRFPATSDGMNDPGHNTGHLNGHESGTDWRGRARSFHISCEKVLVDWILTFAFEHIRSIPKITLYGYIKTSTKAKWDRSFNVGNDQDERNEDVEMAKVMVQNWDRNDLGPSCHCTNFCGQIYRESFKPKGKRKTVWRRKPSEFDYED